MIITFSDFVFFCLGFGVGFFLCAAWVILQILKQ